MQTGDTNANLQTIRRELEKLQAQELLEKVDVDEIVNFIGVRINAKAISKKAANGKSNELPSSPQLRRVQTEPNINIIVTTY